MIGVQLIVFVFALFVGFYFGFKIGRWFERRKTRKLYSQAI